MFVGTGFKPVPTGQKMAIYCGQILLMAVDKIVILLLNYNYLDIIILAKIRYKFNKIS